MKRNATIILSAGLVAAVAVLAALRWLPSGWVMPRTAPPEAKPVAVEGEQPRPVETPQVVALGRLVPGQGVIDVSGTPGDRLAEIMTTTGAWVEAGTELARLESYSIRAAEVEFAEAALQEATEKQQLERAYGDTLVAEAEIAVDGAKLQELQVKAQRAKLKLLSEVLASAKQDAQRLTGLDEAIVSTQQREHQQLSVEKAAAEFEAAQLALDTLEKQHDFGLRQAEQKYKAAEVSRDRLVGAVQLSALKNNVELAKRRLAMATVRAPISGRVLDIAMQPGETIGQRPILRLGDTQQMYAVAEVYETEIGRIHAGQTATITSHALAQPLEGRVEYVGTMVAKNEVMSLDPTKSADLRVVEVRVRIDPRFTDAAAQLVNLQVQVAIKTGG